jgi:hypothetical protein
MVPSWLWSAPIPVVGLAQDWNLQWHHFRRCLRWCDLVLTDSRAVELLQREGIGPALSMDLFGSQKRFVEFPWPTVSERDIDILYVGYLNQAIHRERLPWLGRLADLSDRYRVLIEQNVFDDDYCRLLGRAKIAFNRTLGSVSNRRVWEAVAAGALLFVEEENLELPAVLEPGRECVYFRDDNLEELLEYYLTHEEERQALVMAARQKLEQHSYWALWEQQLPRIEEHLPEMRQRRQERQPAAPAEQLRTRLWQRLCAHEGGDPGLRADLAAAGDDNALGVLAALEGDGQAPRPALAAMQFRRAVARDPWDLLAGLNLAEALARLDDHDGAVAAARSVVEGLTETANINPASWDGCCYPPAYELFRVEWEKAA